MLLPCLIFNLTLRSPDTSRCEKPSVSRCDSSSKLSAEETGDLLAYATFPFGKMEMTGAENVEVVASYIR